MQTISYNQQFLKDSGSIQNGTEFKLQAGLMKNGKIMDFFCVDLKGYCKQFPNLLIEVKDTQLFVLDNKLDQINGFTQQLLGCTNHVSVLDLKSRKQWKQICSINKARQGHKAFVTKQKIWAFGGCNYYQNLDSIESYDPYLINDLHWNINCQIRLHNSELFRIL